jgi:ribonucleotide monophosphatase NagD (HAD superfamily)
MGGEVVYYGKPHKAIYRATLAAGSAAAKREILRPLAIGDGIETDVKGANGAGVDALFIADGIHGEDIHEFSAEHLAALFAKSGVTAQAAMRALVW